MSVPPGHRLDCKLSLGGKVCSCDYYSRRVDKEIKKRTDGTTWMVSMIGPNQDDGSAWYSERAGKSAFQAAKGYFADDDNKGAEELRKFPDESVICVIDQAIAPSGKQWHVHLFCIENGKVRRFPG